jgi:IS5 family transposase
MLRLKDSLQMNLFECLLPPELTQLSAELAKVDTLLDDEQFLAPLIGHFTSNTGRPSIPMEAYLRMMYLKFRHQMGYETLVQEVADSIKWRIFCRLPFDKPVPDASTLIKLTKKFGPEAVENLNRVLVDKAREKKLVRGGKLRTDTTVVEANIHHPTDASLLSDCVRVITRTVKKIREQGVAVGAGFHDRTRSVKKQIYSIAKVLRRRTGEAIKEVRQITGAIMDTAEAVVAQAGQVIAEARKQTGNVARKVERTVESLESTLEIAKRIIDQTATVLQGNTHIRDRIVSIFDPDARPIMKGKLKSPTEFGTKILIQDAENRIITRYQILEGNPSDEDLLIPAVDAHIETFGRPPGSVAADRGFASASNETALLERGVKKCSLPRRGKLTKSRQEFQSQPWFRRLQRWRAGEEAQISLLKRRYGLGRSLSRGARGTASWIGFGILAHNLWRVAILT